MSRNTSIFGQDTLKAPVSARSPKLSNGGTFHYLDV